MNNYKIISEILGFKKRVIQHPYFGKITLGNTKEFYEGHFKDGTSFRFPVSMIDKLDFLVSYFKSIFSDVHKFKKAVADKFLTIYRKKYGNSITVKDIIFALDDKMGAINVGLNKTTSLLLRDGNLKKNALFFITIDFDVNVINIETHTDFNDDTEIDDPF